MLAPTIQEREGGVTDIVPLIAGSDPATVDFAAFLRRRPSRDAASTKYAVVFLDGLATDQAAVEAIAERVRAARPACLCLVSSFRVHFGDPAAIEVESLYLRRLEGLAERVVIFRPGHLLTAHSRLGARVRRLGPLFAVVPESLGSCFVEGAELFAAIEHAGDEAASRRVRTHALLGRNQPWRAVAAVPGNRAGRVAAAVVSAVLRCLMVGWIVAGCLRLLAKRWPGLTSLNFDTLCPRSLAELLTLYNPYNFRHVKIAGYNNGVVHFGHRHPGKTIVSTVGCNKLARVRHRRPHAPREDLPHAEREAVGQVANLPDQRGLRQVSNLPHVKDPHAERETVGQVANLPDQRGLWQVSNLPHGVEQVGNLPHESGPAHVKDPHAEREAYDVAEFDCGVTIRRALDVLSGEGKELHVVPNYSYVSLGTAFFVPIHGSASTFCTVGETITKVILYDPVTDQVIAAKAGDGAFGKYLFNLTAEVLLLRVEIQVKEKSQYHVRQRDVVNPPARDVWEWFHDPFASNVEVRKAGAASPRVTVYNYFTQAPGGAGGLELPRDRLGSLWDRLEENPLTSVLFHTLSRRLAHHVELFLSEAEFTAFWETHGALPISKIQLRFIRRDGFANSPFRDHDCISADLFMLKKHRPKFEAYLKQTLPAVKMNPGKHSMG